jgi:hypothetical protein
LKILQVIYIPYTLSIPIRQNIHPYLTYIRLVERFV